MKILINIDENTKAFTFYLYFSCISFKNFNVPGIPRWSKVSNGQTIPRLSSWLAEI